METQITQRLFKVYSVTDKSDASQNVIVNMNRKHNANIDFLSFIIKEQHA